MTSISIGFSRPKTWKPFAELIMLGYGIPYDHAYVRFHSDFYNRDVIYQASSTMVNFMSPVIFECNNVIVKEFQIQITDENRKAMVGFAMDNAGKPYGIKECFGLAWVRLNEIVGRRIKNPFADGGTTYVCCEMAAAILNQYSSIKVPYDLDNLNPKELYNFMEKVSNG